MTIAVFPGTFDPITKGHLDIAERGCKIFDHVYVAVYEDSDKSTLFNLKERINMFSESTSHLTNISIGSYKGLTVNYAKKLKATVIIRGLRIGNDFEYERGMALVNREIDNKVETVCLISAMPNQFISSSRVKEIASLGGEFKKFIPESIYSIAKTKLKGERR
jgi:pantetheine-phosphate adenylyltransferase